MELYLHDFCKRMDGEEVIKSMISSVFPPFLKGSHAGLPFNFIHPFLDLRRLVRL